MTALKDGPLRYTQIHHSISNTSSEVVHNKTLRDTLNYLRDQALVGRHDDGDHVQYELTVGGAGLVDLLGEIGRWTREHRPDDDT